MNADLEQIQKVGCVIVTYQPDSEDLLQMVRAIRPQVSMLCVVDNGDGSALPTALSTHDLEIIKLGENYGIARAQNVGIECLEAHGCNFLLLLDQDSAPAPNMVERLMAIHQDLRSKGNLVASVGPSYIDERQGDVASFVYRNGLSLKRRDVSGAVEYVETDFLIASGCLISLEALNTIGPMREELFIDYVDIEWGLRAQAMGYASFGVMSAKMGHSLGDQWITFRGRMIPVHSPLRHYYHIRNAIWLARQTWISSAWKAILFWRILRQFLFFTFLAPNGVAHCSMMLKGLRDGLLQRMGRFAERSSQQGKESVGK